MPLCIYRGLRLFIMIVRHEQDVNPPSDDEVLTWTEAELRKYFASGGAPEARPEERDTSVAGGARRLTFDPRSSPKNAPPQTTSMQDSHLTADVYRQVLYTVVYGCVRSTRQREREREMIIGRARLARRLSSHHPRVSCLVLSCVFAQYLYFIQVKCVCRWCITYRFVAHLISSHLKQQSDDVKYSMFIY